MLNPFNLAVLARILSRWPRRRAEFSPSTYFRARAQFHTVSIRYLTRLAVSAFVIHIGSIAFKTRSVFKSEMHRLPKIGNAYVVNELLHCCACLAFFHSGFLLAMHWSAASLNVIDRACFSCLIRLTRPRSSIGSNPLKTCRRHSTAKSRATAKDMRLSDPKPISRCLAVTGDL